MDKKLLRSLIVFISIVVVLLTADLVIKQVVYVTLAGQPEVPFIPGFWSWRYTANTDIGFSLLTFLDKILPPVGKLVLIVSLQFLGVAVAVYFFVSPKNYLGSWIKRLPLALIAAGGLGNAIDRIIRGFVVDYIYWYNIPLIGRWPIFNLADSCTVVAVITLIIIILFTKEEKKPAQAPLENGSDEPPKT